MEEEKEVKRKKVRSSVNRGGKDEKNVGMRRTRRRMRARMGRKRRGRKTMRVR